MLLKTLRCGNDITYVPLQKRNIGLVFQENTLFPHLSVFNNIIFPLKVRKTCKEKREEIAIKLAKELNIEHLLHRNTESLLGGEQKRVLLARTLALDPDIFLLDEPLSSLDTRNKENIIFLLKELNNRGITILHITHDLNEALFLSNRIAFMDHGKIVQSGKAAELFNNPGNEFIAKFLGIHNFYRITWNDGNEVILNDKFRIRHQFSNITSQKLIIPEDAIIIEKPGVYNHKAVVKHAVEYPGRIEVYLDAKIPIRSSIKPSAYKNYFQPGNEISFSLNTNRLVFL
jgi:ABC-type sugar transport system ATPase subunit